MQLQGVSLIPRPSLSKPCVGSRIHHQCEMPVYFQESQIDPWPPILLKSIATHLPFLSRYFCKSMPSLCQQVLYTPPPICIRIRLPFVSQCFYRSIRVRGRWSTPKCKCLPLGPFCGSYLARSSPHEEPSGTRYCLTAFVSSQSFKGQKGVSARYGGLV